jgi:poly-gamma-glutamate synthesis protein (capsule biosynthesis protein)
MDPSVRLPERPGSNRLRVHTSLAVRQRELDMLQELSRTLGYETRKAANDKVGYRQTPGTGFDFYGLRFEAAEAPHENRWTDSDDTERNLRAIERIAADVDLAMVYVHHHHWYPTWDSVPEWFRSFAHRCIDAGARLVASHGVPMLQGIEIYKGAPLFYGLGNFIFHTFQPAKYTDERIWQSVVARAAFESGICNRIELCPIVLGGERAIKEGRYDARRVPHLASAEYGEGILQRLASLSQVFGTQIDIENGRGVIRPVKRSAPGAARADNSRP